MSAARLPEKITMVPVHKIYPDLNQPRQHYDLESLVELANSIMHSTLLKPILVEQLSRSQQKDPNLAAMLDRFNAMVAKGIYNHYDGPPRNPALNPKYLIVCGSRRFLAHHIAGIRKIKAKVIKDLSYDQRLSLQIAEDSQEAIPPYEVAPNIVAIYEHKIELEKKKTGKEIPPSLTSIAERLGRSVEDVKRAIQFCDLAQDIQDAVRDGRYSYRLAAEIGRIKNPEKQAQVFDAARKGNMSLTRLEELVKSNLFEDKMLDPAVLAQIRASYEEGASLDSLIKKYNPLAISQYKGLIGLPSRAGTKVLSTKAKAFIASEITDMDKEERQRYFFRTQHAISREVNSEMAEETLPRDLFDNVIKPDKHSHYADIRHRFYSLLNPTYHKIQTFIALSRIDPMITALFRQEKDLALILESFRKGIARYEQGTRRQTLASGNNPDSLIRNKKGKLLLSKEKAKPNYKIGAQARNIPLEKLVRDEKNVRRTFNQVRLQALADNIKANGQIEEMLVRSLPGDKYKLIAGERRYRALKLLGAKTARCIIADNIDPVQIIELQIVEDSQMPFRPEERAMSWFNLYKLKNIASQKRNELCTVPEFAASIGKSASAVREAFAYLSLPESIKALVELDVLSYGSAKELAYLPHRMNASRNNYHFNPETDFYLTPDQVFRAGKHEFEGLQYKLALKAAYFSLPNYKVKAMIVKHAEYERSGKTSPLLFDKEELERITDDSERRSIVADLLKVLVTFEAGMGSFLMNGHDDQYSFQVINYDLVVEKMRLVGKSFGSLYTSLVEER